MAEDGKSVVRQDRSNEAHVKTVMNIIGNIKYERDGARKCKKTEMNKERNNQFS